ncbi:amidohydrolase family protein [Parelusimicrobium proximum]|uniref:amidohydrolase family protein n=1 Tax=Parelusimicrobium proximum TaxID=3228953 RepID=UPI003D174F64
MNNQHIPAEYFGLYDRGVIEARRRADLVLIDGDPTRDISATKNISAVWIKGQRVR